jgi:hypothetical protein
LDNCYLKIFEKRKENVTVKTNDTVKEINANYWIHHKPPESETVKIGPNRQPELPTRPAGESDTGKI